MSRADYNLMMHKNITDTNLRLLAKFGIDKLVLNEEYGEIYTNSIENLHELENLANVAQRTRTMGLPVDIPGLPHERPPTSLVQSREIIVDPKVPENEGKTIKEEISLINLIMPITNEEDYKKRKIARERKEERERFKTIREF